MVASTADLCVEPLDGKHHDRAGFDCGSEPLNVYLKTQATQDIRRKSNAVFVLVELAAPRDILGYFTLCALGLLPGDIPENARKLVPRYPQVSATLIARLAVSKARQGQGLGSILLARALRVSHDNAAVVGSSMVVVDALDHRAAAFYRAHGFVPLPESPRLVLPMRTVATLF